MSKLPIQKEKAIIQLLELLAASNIKNLYPFIEDILKIIEVEQTQQ